LEPSLPVVETFVLGDQTSRVQEDTHGIIEVDAMLAQVARSLGLVPFELRA
jgi:hypothetical protein